MSGVILLSYIYQGDKNKAKWYYIGESTVEKIATVEDQIWFYTQPFLPDMEPTLLNVNQTGLPTGRPSATNNNYTFAWCVPSGTSGKYPEELKIDGKHRSFVYQFGMELDALTEDALYPAYYIVPGTTAITYRLININPRFIASQNQGN